MTAWWCTVCGDQTGDPPPSRPSLDERYAVAYCNHGRRKRDKSPADAELVPVVTTQSKALDLIAAATYTRAVRKRARHQELTKGEEAALAARRS